MCEPGTHVGLGFAELLKIGILGRKKKFSDVSSMILARATNIHVALHVTHTTNRSTV